MGWVGIGGVIKSSIHFVKLRSRSGEGQDGQSQAKSSSENSKIKYLDLSQIIKLVFTHPPPAPSRKLKRLKRGLNKSD